MAATDTGARGVVLGGEHIGRGLVRGSRSAPEWAAVLIFIGIGLTVALVGAAQIWAILVGLGIAGLGLCLFTNFSFFGGQHSLGTQAWIVGKHWWRKRTSRATFTPPRMLTATADTDDAATPPGSGRKPRSARRPAMFELPAGLGQSIQPVNVPFANGSSIALLRHSSPAMEDLWTVTFEIRGGVGGVGEEDQDWRSHQAWSRFTGGMARRGSLVRTLQQTARVMPFDTTDHETWLRDVVPVEDNPSRARQLVQESYLELLQQTPHRAEQHRTWLTIGMPITAMWRRRAGSLGRGFDGDRALAWDQIKNVMARARACGLALRPLSEPQLAGVVRALLDPSEPIDRPLPHGLVDAFLPMDDTDARHVVVGAPQSPGRWYTRTIRVHSRSLSGVPIRPDFLRPLLTGVEPSVVRTLSSSVILTPSRQARAQALTDASRDLASARADRSVSDGTEEVQAAGSQVRLEDLRPGSGVHGAAWSLAITYSARTPDELEEAEEAISSAADESMITEIEHADREHMAAHLTVLPLGRGIREKNRWTR